MGKARTPSRPVMSTDEWLEKNLAASPPLTPKQIANLRPILLQMIPHMKAAWAERAGRRAVSGAANSLGLIEAAADPATPGAGS